MLCISSTCGCFVATSKHLFLDADHTYFLFLFPDCCCETVHVEIKQVQETLSRMLVLFEQSGLGLENTHQSRMVQQPDSRVGDDLDSLLSSLSTEPP